jgi:hypothetical protein
MTVCAVQMTIHQTIQMHSRQPNSRTHWVKRHERLRRSRLPNDQRPFNPTAFFSNVIKLPCATLPMVRRTLNVSWLLSFKYTILHWKKMIVLGCDSITVAMFVSSWNCYYFQDYSHRVVLTWTSGHEVDWCRFIVKVIVAKSIVADIWTSHLRYEILTAAGCLIRGSTTSRKQEYGIVSCSTKQTQCISFFSCTVRRPATLMFVTGMSPITFD